MLSNLRLLQGQKKRAFIAKYLFLVLMNCLTPKPCAFICLSLYVLWKSGRQETFWVQGIIYHYWWDFGNQAIPPAQTIWAKRSEKILVGLEGEGSSWSCVLRCFAPINFSSESLSCESVLCLGKSKAGKPQDFPHRCKCFQICQIYMLRM